MSKPEPRGPGSVDLLFTRWAAARSIEVLTGADLDVAAPVVAGRYRLSEIIGAGSAGSVYLATDSRLGRDVALKTIDPRGMGEALALARVSHHGVVTLLDHGVDAGTGYLVLEFIEGRDLERWASAEPRSRADILEAWLAVGRALAAVHAAGVVHGDIKPANVVMDASDRPRLVDFSLAHPTTTERGRDGAGTPAFMAPEQLDGQPSTVASDQFSFCLGLWSQLAGADPFAGSTAAARSLAYTDGPRGAGPGGRLERVLARGLSLDPAARWPSVAALVLEVRRAVQARTRRRHGGGLSLALVAAIALGSLFGGESGARAWSLTLPTDALVLLAVREAEAGRPGPALAILSAAAAGPGSRAARAEIGRAGDLVGLRLYGAGEWSGAFEAHALAYRAHIEAGDSAAALVSLDLARAAVDARSLAAAR